MNGELPDLFTQVRGIGILGSSPFGHSANFAFAVLGSSPWIFCFVTFVVTLERR
jgi:hypothetical protein